MEPISHTLWALAVFGKKNWRYLLVGTFIVDSLYVLSAVTSMEILHTIGQYGHSVFIAAIVLVLALVLRSSLRWLFFGHSFHVFLDILTHTCDGSRYLFPLSTEIVKWGFVCWRNPLVIMVSITVASVLVWGRYNQEKKENTRRRDEIH